MFLEESLWIREALGGIRPGSEILDVGSSTSGYRLHDQPFIYENVFGQMEARGAKVYYLDQRREAGVDYVLDVEKASAGDIGRQFDAVLCCNLLEHVNGPQRVAKLLEDLVKPDGLMIVTVPRRMRYHPDPIDTLYRPTLDELIALFKGMRVLKSGTIPTKDGKTYGWLGWKGWLMRSIPQLNWSVNCLLMKKD